MHHGTCTELCIAPGDTLILFVLCYIYPLHFCLCWLSSSVCMARLIKFFNKGTLCCFFKKSVRSLSMTQTLPDDLSSLRVVMFSMMLIDLQDFICIYFFMFCYSSGLNLLFLKVFRFYLISENHFATLLLLPRDRPEGPDPHFGNQ